LQYSISITEINHGNIRCGKKFVTFFPLDVTEKTPRTFSSNIKRHHSFVLQCSATIYSKKINADNPFVQKVFYIFVSFFFTAFLSWTSRETNAGKKIAYTSTFFYVQFFPCLSRVTNCKLLWYIIKVTNPTKNSNDVSDVSLKSSFSKRFPNVGINLVLQQINLRSKFEFYEFSFRFANASHKEVSNQNAPHKEISNQNACKK